MIPGSNLLNLALTVIQKRPYQYLQFLGRATNDIGIDVPTYAPAVERQGSIQAVERTLYQHMGLDWKKNYITIFDSEELNGVGRDSSGDKVIFAGKTFLVESEGGWQPIDGWSGVLCVEIQGD